MLEDIVKNLNGVEFRPYQDRIVSKVIKYYYDENLKNLLIQSPTGSGKTLVALSIIKLMQTVEPSLKVSWVAMRKHLLAQADNENRLRGFNNSINFISMFQYNDLPETDLLIVDESQHDSTNSCAHIHNTVKPKYVLGMTATPFRSDRVKLCFDKVINDAGIGELIRLGYLSQYHHWTIPTWNAEEICQFYIKESKKWGQSIIFFHRHEQCYEARATLQEASINCEVVTGTSDKEEQLRKFRCGEISVLLNCMMLTEGLDIPSLKTVFVRPSCKGLTIQMAGRVFRKFPGIPIKNIVQCTKTKWPFLRTAMPLKQHKWETNGSEGAWTSIEGNNNSEVGVENITVALAQIVTELPKFLTEKRKVRRRRMPRI